jgi:hypothetical protein
MFGVLGGALEYSVVSWGIYLAVISSWSVMGVQNAPEHRGLVDHASEHIFGMFGQRMRCKELAALYCLAKAGIGHDTLE